jgi:hypothetical protein
MGRLSNPSRVRRTKHRQNPDRSDPIVLPVHHRCRRNDSYPRGYKRCHLSTNNPGRVQQWVHHQAATLVTQAGGRSER